MVTGSFRLRWWHALILIPVLMIAVVAVLLVETALKPCCLTVIFAHFWLSSWNIDFDQRNALVDGLRYGFRCHPLRALRCEDAIFSYCQNIYPMAPLALGATAWQTLIYVVLLTASPRVSFSGHEVGLGRKQLWNHDDQSFWWQTVAPNSWLEYLDENVIGNDCCSPQLPESEVGGSHFRLLFLSCCTLAVYLYIRGELSGWVQSWTRREINIVRCFKSSPQSLSIACELFDWVYLRTWLFLGTASEQGRSWWIKTEVIIVLG